MRRGKRFRALAQTKAAALAKACAKRKKKKQKRRLKCRTPRTICKDMHVLGCRGSIRKHSVRNVCFHLKIMKPNTTPLHTRCDNVPMRKLKSCSSVINDFRFTDSDNRADMYMKYIQNKRRGAGYFRVAKLLAEKCPQSCG